MSASCRQLNTPASPCWCSFFRPFPLNEKQPYHMLYTTAATNGFDGIAIMPRFAGRPIFSTCLDLVVQVRAPARD
jgi:hypothetical protein